MSNNNTFDLKGLKKSSFSEDDVWITEEEKGDFESENENIEYFVERICCQAPESFLDIIKTTLKESVSFGNTLYDDERVSKLYWTLDEHKDVSKIIEKWDPEITNGKYVAIGFKIDGNRGDDIIYSKNKILQNFLPRGILFVQNTITKKISLDVFSNKKFYGKGNGDDDDSFLTTNSLGDDSEAVSFIVTEKANGENAQVSLLLDDGNVVKDDEGRCFWIIGSKNKKILARNSDDLKKYKKKKEYFHAVENAKKFFDHIESFTNERLKEFVDFLSLTKWTLVFELESTKHQHIVKLEETSLRFIAATGIHLYHGSVNPIVSNAFASYFLFDTLMNLSDDFQYPIEELELYCQENVYVEFNSEGKVLVLLDKRNMVIDYVKAKTWWYVVLRAMREKFKFLNKFNKSSVLEKLKIRLNNIKKDMNVDESFIDIFYVLSDFFCEYLLEDIDERIGNIRINYPISWENFLKFNNLPLDDTLVKGLPHVNNIIYNDLKDVYTINQRSYEDIPLLVIVQGIPGIGKSHISQIVSSELNEESISTIVVCQDDFDLLKSKNNNKKNDNIFSDISPKFDLKYIRKKKSTDLCFEFTEECLKTHKVVIVARNNPFSRDYDKYLKLDHQGKCKTIFVYPEEFSKVGNLKNDLKKIDLNNESEIIDLIKSNDDYISIYRLALISAARVCYRRFNNEESKCISHPTDKYSLGKLMTLTFKFLGSLQCKSSGFPIRYTNESDIYDFDYNNSLIIQGTKYIKSGLQGRSKDEISIDNDDTSDQFSYLSSKETLEEYMQWFEDNQEKIVKSFKHIITSQYDKYIPPYGSYISVILSGSDSQDLLTSVLDELDIQSFPSKWQDTCNHVTLMHSIKFHDNKDLWEFLMSKKGTVVEITPTKLYYNEKQLCVIQVDLQIKNLNNNNNNNDDEFNIQSCCTSGITHITISSCVPNYRSISCLRPYQTGNIDKYIYDHSKLKKYTGILHLMYQNEN